MDSLVKQKLRERGWSQADLARRLGCSKDAVSKLVRGEMVSPYLQRSTALVLGVHEETLWGDLHWFRRFAATQATPTRRRILPGRPAKIRIAE